MRYLFENAGGKNEDAVNFLRTRAEELRKESEAAEQKLQDYRRKHNLVSLDNSITLVSDRPRGYNTSLTESRRARLEVERELEQIERVQQSGGNLLDLGYISSYGNITALRNR